MRLPTPLIIGWLFTVSVVLAFAPSVQAAEPAPGLDIRDFQDALSVLSDGNGHYVVVVTFAGANKTHKVGSHLFYGDGQVFYEQRVSGGGSNSTDKTFNRYLWEPRAKASLRARGDAYTIQCDERETAFRVVPKAQAETLLANGRFNPPLWKRRAYALTRDDNGTYYYVDRAREPPGNFDFRLSRGNRGDMKALKLANIVSDSEGDIFITRGGSLRLTWDRTRGNGARRSEWVEKRKTRALVDVPVSRNAVLIYRDLGMYDGQRLGTPCDDL
ncbi:MAG: hypothetical protein VX938_10115 [Myxococcota bacterium]|nr:hypothetical protein [Myxococcota bacterium]